MLRPISRHKEKGRDLQKQNSLEKGHENSSPFKMFISPHFLWGNELFAKRNPWVCTKEGKGTSLEGQHWGMGAQAEQCRHHQTSEPFLAPAQCPPQPLTWHIPPTGTGNINYPKMGGGTSKHAEPPP